MTTTTKAAYIECRNLTHQYPSGLVALTDVSIEVEEGQVGVLLGPSGCGKTTLLNLFAGFFKQTTGDLTVGGRRVEQPGPDRMVVFQDHALFAWMTVEENIMRGMFSCQHMSNAEKRARTRELISMVRLDGFNDAYPAQLSGGMRQRAGLARALAPKPSALMLDEPFGALDALTREQLQDDLVNVLRQTKVTGLLVTHSIEEAVYLGDVVYSLAARPGRVHRVWRREGDRPTDRTNQNFLAAVADLRREFATLGH